MTGAQRGEADPDPLTRLDAWLERLGERLAGSRAARTLGWLAVFAWVVIITVGLWPYVIEQLAR